MPGEEHSHSDSGKTEVFFRLFMKNQKRIYTYILMLVPNNSDADDIMQETATALWQQFERFESGTNFAAWAVRVAHYRVLQFYKKQRNSCVKFAGELLETIVNQAVGMLEKDDDQLVEAIQECVELLGEKDKSIIRMRYEKDFSPKKIAEVLGRSIQGLYKSMARIHTILLECVRRKTAMEKLC